MLRPSCVKLGLFTADLECAQICAFEVKSLCAALCIYRNGADIQGRETCSWDAGAKVGIAHGRWRGVLPQADGAEPRVKTKVAPSLICA